MKPKEKPSNANQREAMQATWGNAKCCKAMSGMRSNAKHRKEARSNVKH
jgi:hypothetical protein